MLDLTHITSLLVQSPNWVGDVVMATPALRALRNGFPDAKITLLTRKTGSKILAGAPWFDDVVLFDRKAADRGPLALFKMARKIRHLGVDLAVILPNSFSSGLLAFLAGCRRRAGYGPGRSWLLTDYLSPVMEGRRRRPAYMVDYYGDLLECLGIPRGENRLELFVREEEEAECEAFLFRHGLSDDEGAPLVALNPGASFGPSKLWLTDRFAAVGDELVKRNGCRVLLLCGPGEESLADEIASKMTQPVVNTGADMVGLGALKPLMRRLSLLITTDTGARHFAVAFGKPVVVLMGSTDPRYTQGNLEKTVVLREEVDCAPCHLKICPIDHRCMERISVDRVLEAARTALGR